MKRRVGIIMMILGAVLVFSALSLLFYNRMEDNKAGEQSKELLQGVLEAIDESVSIIPDNYINPGNTEMKAVEIDAYSYVGYISIPTLSLELPVMADWDYSLMKVAPCRYSGSSKDNNLVIAAHNYGRHFGNVLSLKPGDAVFFTDMEGNVNAYIVASIEILQPDQVSEMVEGDWDLTLFTCTYSGSERVTVRCVRK